MRRVGEERRQPDRAGDARPRAVPAGRAARSTRWARATSASGVSAFRCTTSEPGVLPNRRAIVACVSSAGLGRGCMTVRSDSSGRIGPGQQQGDRRATTANTASEQAMNTRRCRATQREQRRDREAQAASRLRRLSAGVAVADAVGEDEQGGQHGDAGQEHAGQPEGAEQREVAQGADVGLPDRDEPEDGREPRREHRGDQAARRAGGRRGGRVAGGAAGLVVRQVVDAVVDAHAEHHRADRGRQDRDRRLDQHVRAEPEQRPEHQRPDRQQQQPDRPAVDEGEQGGDAEQRAGAAGDAVGADRPLARRRDRVRAAERHVEPRPCSRPRRRRWRRRPAPWRSRGRWAAAGRPRGSAGPGRRRTAAVRRCR